MAWSIEALSNSGLRPARHHVMLLDELSAVERGDVPRLMVLMPPGSAKSTYASMLFPAWYLARNPTHAVIAASHTADLAERFGRRVRNLIVEHSATLGVALAPDIQAAGQWETTERGEYYAAGVMGPITGRRADLCIVEGALIQTPHGKVPIENIQVGTKTSIVLSYGTTPTYRRVVAVARRKADDISRVRTVSGRVVEATAGHRFFTSRGWREASSLVAGDVLLRAVPFSDQPVGLRGGEEGAQGGGPGVGLFGDVSCGDGQYSARPAAATMPTMRRLDAARPPHPDIVFRRMPEGCPSQVNDAIPTMRDMWRSIQAEIIEECGAFLLAPMQESWPQGAYVGGAQSELPAWSRQRDGGFSGLVCRQEGSLGAGRDGVRGLHINRPVGSPPHQHDTDRSSLDQSCLLVPPLPSAGAFTVEADPVAVVERVCGTRNVFDLQVEGTHCFFANDILVHNCVIDDPVKSRQEADSEVIRERVWEWWKSDLTTRMKPGAKVVLIMTRWHEDDLGGRLLNDMATGGRPWKVLRLPMEAEPGDVLGRATGEPLWPEWFTDDMRAEARRDTRTWSALYQQAPAPDTGSYFAREWLRPVSSLPPRQAMRIYGASDYAVTDDGGDYTVHVVVGLDSDHRLWLLDVWRGQTASDVWVESFCDLVLRWKPIGWAQENGQIKAGIGPFLTRRMRDRRAYVARQDFPTRGDKSVRAQAIRGRMALDGLYVPAGAPWRADLEAELLSFPVGKHDDQVDALGLVGQLLDRMIEPTPQPDPDAPMRGAADMTIDEAWQMANPRDRAFGRGDRI